MMIRQSVAQPAAASSMPYVRIGVWHHIFFLVFCSFFIFPGLCPFSALEVSPGWILHWHVLRLKNQPPKTSRFWHHSHPTARQTAISGTAGCERLCCDWLAVSIQCKRSTFLANSSMPQVMFTLFKFGKSHVVKSSRLFLHSINNAIWKMNIVIDFLFDRI